MMNEHNFFGTDGIRTKVGKTPLTKSGLQKLAHAIAQWLRKKFGNNIVLVIARDTRESSPWMHTTLLNTLLEYPFVIYDMHEAPTGAASWTVQNKQEVVCGLVITASHNAFADNGIKILLKDEKITPQDQQLLSKLFFTEQTPYAYKTFGTYRSTNNILEEYTKALIAQFNPQFLAGIKVVLDCANGAMSRIAPQVFTRCGAQVIAIANQPNGKNINSHCGSTNPKDLQNTVIEHNAHIGFSFDGDGDRVIAVNKNGHIKDGDHILSLLLENPRYKNTTEVVGTLMSNQALEDYCNKKGILFTRTSVGDSNILHYMLQKNLMLGGEPCGHIILRDHIATSDGLYTALQIAHTCILLNDFTIDLIRTFPHASINIPYRKKVNLELPQIKRIITKAQQSGARVIVRYSGTEPVLRVMVEARTQSQAARMLHEIATQFKIIVGQKEFYDKKNKTVWLQPF